MHGSDGEESTCNADLGLIPGEDPLEKGTATHSSILAGRISWTLEPGRPQSMGSQRVRNDLATFTLIDYKCVCLVIQFCVTLCDPMGY